MGKELLRENKKILYKIHEYDPADQTKNVHHIVDKSLGGSDRLDNLSLLPIEFHAWLHQLEDKLDKNA